MTDTERALRDALEQEQRKFRQETLRTSELSALLRRFIDEHHVRGGHPAERWSKECVLCVLLTEAVELLASPINRERKP